MMIDAHHHLWQFNREDYGWMDDSMEILKRDYLPGELKEQMAGAGVSGTVVVQARQTTEETRWLLKLAGENDFIKGVVGWIDLKSDRLEEQLEKFSIYPKLVGVRHVIHDERDDDFMLRDDFVKGISKLRHANLSYDLLLFPRHLSRAIKLAVMFPDQRFVLDHLSKPLVREGILEPWREDITALAAQPNVWCKISGMVTEADHKNWKYEDFVPYLDVVMKAFGPDRLMLGSDWPVCRLAGEYRDVMEIGIKYFAEADEQLKNKIFADNCKSFYNILLP